MPAEVNPILSATLCRRRELEVAELQAQQTGLTVPNSANSRPETAETIDFSSDCQPRRRIAWSSRGFSCRMTTRSTTRHTSPPRPYLDDGREAATAYGFGDRGFRRRCRPSASCRVHKCGLEAGA